MKKRIWIFSCCCLLFFYGCDKPKQDRQQTIEGWNILSDRKSQAIEVIERSTQYGINHLQLSHSIVMDLNDVKEPETATMVNQLTRKAHESGIEEVTVWDHSLYHLDYYPDKFKTGPDSTINLDNPAFWAWIKEDYRSMLDKVPEIDGIILTFIETGAHVEDQYSEVLKTEEAKLAAMVDSLASVIIDERDLRLYVRTFIYTRAELGSLLNCIKLIENPEVRVMTKETPHDFFLTHPVSKFVEDIDAPTIIEFDAAHEYNGQGILASIFPELHLKRWSFYKELPNVIGYVARTDRYNNTSIINTPSEINLYALHASASNDETIETDSIYHEFIRERYGENAIIYLKPAFECAQEVILSTLYTLGLPLSNHSRLDIENASAYQRHVSGKWIANYKVHINRGMDTTLHYWKDIVNHLAPKWLKDQNNHTQLVQESKWVLDSGWLDPEEKMNEAYLKLIIDEKQYGAEMAEKALNLVRKAKAHVTNEALYDTTLHVYERTKLTADLYLAISKAYFGYRVYSRGKEFQNGHVNNIIVAGIEDLKTAIEAILDYEYSGPTGQYRWREDAFKAMQFYLDLKLLERNQWQTPYSNDTFTDFGYGYISDERKKVIREAYLKEGNVY